MLSDKSLKYTLTIDPTNAIEHADALLLSLTPMIPTIGLTPQALSLLHFAFKYLDFKAVNIEVVENVTNTLKTYLFDALC
jgi:hypothetical protein